MRRLKILLPIVFLVMALQADAQAPQAKLAPAALHALCAHLQKDGWVAPGDPLNSHRKEAAEFDIPGVAYYCNLEHPLHGSGPGHAPLLQVLISDTGDAPGVIFSAAFWCAADGGAAFAALAAQIEKQLATISVQAPAEILAAARAGLEREINTSGLHFKAVRNDVDPQACSKVPDN